MDHLFWIRAHGHIPNRSRGLSVRVAEESASSRIGCRSLTLTSTRLSGLKANLMLAEGMAQVTCPPWLSFVAAMTRRVFRSLPFIPYPLRIDIDAVERPHYGYCVFHAAKLAKQLGLRKMSVIEFGVAGGNGLVNLECHAIEAKKHLDIDVEVYGFDTGVGLPEPTDYRDQPYHIGAVDFSKWIKPSFWHVCGLQKLFLGELPKLLPSFTEKYNPASIGAIFVGVELLVSRWRCSLY